MFADVLQSMSGACLFLAAKVEEQPRKLEHVIRTGYMCTHRDQPPLDVKSDVSAAINSCVILQLLLQQYCELASQES